MSGPTVPPRGEDAVLVAVQSGFAGAPQAVTVARAMSYFGEHSLGWLALAALGAALRPGRRRQWITSGAGAFAAHAVAVLIKRVVRRTRPDHPDIEVNVGTPSRLSFPSAHTASTTAAAILMGSATGLPLPAVLIPAMALSRLLLGVHYPTDVVTGVAVGALTAKGTEVAATRLRHRR